MIASFQLITLLVNEYFTPEWQKEVRYITREGFLHFFRFVM